MKFYRSAVALCLTVLSLMLGPGLMAQNLNRSNLTTSPYNRYGYGRMGSTGNTITRSMGDVGFAVRSNQYTNLSNPASLTAIDTLTMIFTVGIDGQYGTYTEGDSRDNSWDAGFSGMSFQMPLWRNFAMSLSFSPYSMVGYSYGTSDSVAIASPTVKHDTLSYSGTHSGVGGINNLMIGLGWRAFHNKRMELNLGANVGWLFGTIEHDATLTTSSQASSTYVRYNASVNGLYLELGAQYTYHIDARQSVTIGGIYTPKLNMSVDTEVLKYSADSISLSNELRGNDVKLPMRYGAGISYNIARKLTVSAEAEVTKWSEVPGLNTEMRAEENLFKDAKRMAAGVEYQPKVLTNHYFMACRYRAGFSAKSSYMKLGTASLREYAANLGMSMPVNKRSSLDWSVGYSTLRPSNGSMVKENYLTFSLGLTFNEMMFFRGRLR